MGMFDQSEKMGSLIIVHSANTAVFANYLQMLISSNDDEGNTIIGVKDGSINTTIWSDKEYLAQKPTLSSNEHILFIGRGKIIPEECYGMQQKFSKYGMSYGWLGKRAYLKITHTSIKKSEVEKFLDYAKKYDSGINVNAILGVDAKVKAIKRKGIAGLMKYGVKHCIVDPALTLTGEYKDRIKSLQYRCLTTVFYREGLANFFEV